ncbi:MAG: hypothetical protein R3345_06390, partial [Fulvivirga sp.]|nr:hypothetical protein [Fulvivirga sp.]
LSAVYMIISRANRLRKTNNFNNSMIEDLDDAIFNADYMIKLSRKVIYWYNLPILSLVLIQLMMNAAGIWVWLLIAAMFGLAYLLGNWEMTKCHIPRKEKLKQLRAKLLELDQQEPLNV